MPRLKHISSGAIVNVPDEKVERLGSEWEVVADEKPKASKPAAARSKKTES